MNPLAFLNPGRWMLYAAAVAALLGLYTWRVHVERDYGRAEVQLRWDAASKKAAQDFASALAAETAKTTAAQDQLNAARAAVEKTDAEHAKIIAALGADLRRATRTAGGPGLRDPWSARCASGGGAQGATAAGAVDSPADASLPGRALSEQVEAIVIANAEDAELINRAYAACRADSLNIRALP